MLNYLIKSTTYIVLPLFKSLLINSPLMYFRQFHNALTLRDSLGLAQILISKL